MKKLMIAAAAAAMVGGAYATEGCVDCGNIVVKPVEQVQEVEIDDCFTEVYNVQFKLKTLASKGVKSGDCQGYCMEQGTRTIDGILWSCCAECANWDPNTQIGDWDFQYCLWEKSSKTLFTDGLAHLNGKGETTTKKYKYSCNSTWNLVAGTAVPVARAGSWEFSGFDYASANEARNAFNIKQQQFNAHGYMQDTNYRGANLNVAAGVARQKALAPTEKNYLSYKFVWVDLGQEIDATHVKRADVVVTRDATVGSTSKWVVGDEGAMMAQWNNEIAGNNVTRAAALTDWANGVRWTARWIDANGQYQNFVAANHAPGEMGDYDGATAYADGSASAGVTIYSPFVGNKAGYTVVANIQEGALGPNYRNADDTKDLIVDTTAQNLPWAYSINWDGARFVLVGTGKDEAAAKAAITLPTFATEAEVAAFNEACGFTRAAGTDLVANNSIFVENAGWQVITKVEDGEDVDPAFRSRYLDTTANIAVYRYGKKADKAEALWYIDTENDAQNGAGLKDENNLLLTAAGFGTVAMDKNYEQFYVKSLSGNCAGAITPLNVSADCAGAIISMCDELGSWCTDGWVATIADTFASGTWTMKYITKASKGIWGLVPSYAK